MHCEFSSLVACQVLIKSRALKREKKKEELSDGVKLFFSFWDLLGIFCATSCPKHAGTALKLE